jgi:hypothetical protein
MTRTATNPYAQKQRLFFAALSLLLILFASYVYFVSAAIVHVIVRKEVDREITALNSRIGDLEASYIEAHGRLDEEAISAFGFKPVRTAVYVRRAPTDLVLAARDES